MSGPQKIEFRGTENNRLVADLWDGNGHPVLFFHGGGQTRHAWDKTAMRLRAAGMCAITVDLRGHGESDWVETGHYAFEHFAADAALVVRAVASEYHLAPAAVGASLGGLASLGAEVRHGPLLESLVLVDIIPRMDPDGVARVQGFMGERMESGFTTLEEAADAISRYLPHRKRPDSLEGLRKNLRIGDDGRYRWHWDPAFFDSELGIEAGRNEYMQELMAELPHLHLPVLLVRGMQSEIVREKYAREFVQMTPNATMVDVGEAGHMVAGDRNDVFADAILDFLTDQEDLGTGT